MGWIGCVRCKKFRCDFVHELLHHYDRFAPSFVTQPNAPQCTKIVRNAPKHEFRVQWGGLGALVAKNCDATSWHELLHQFGPFCTEFRKATKRSSMHPNRTKRTKTLVLGPLGWIGCVRCEKFRRDFVAQNFALVRLVSSARFAPSFVRQPNGPKCTQIVQNAPKHQITVQWGGSDGIGAKKSDATALHGLLH